MFASVAGKVSGVSVSALWQPAKIIVAIIIKVNIIFHGLKLLT